VDRVVWADGPIALHECPVAVIRRARKVPAVLEAFRWAFRVVPGGAPGGLPAHEPVGLLRSGGVLDQEAWLGDALEVVRELADRLLQRRVRAEIAAARAKAGQAGEAAAGGALDGAEG
jgi:hypothetical protein